MNVYELFKFYFLRSISQYGNAWTMHPYDSAGRERRNLQQLIKINWTKIHFCNLALTAFCWWWCESPAGERMPGVISGRAGIWLPVGHEIAVGCALVCLKYAWSASFGLLTTSVVCAEFPMCLGFDFSRWGAYWGWGGEWNVSFIVC